jgi:hypothetical protein
MSPIRTPLLIALIFLFTASCSAISRQVSAIPFADRELVWSDEFNYGSQPDNAKWHYEEGFAMNKEQQYYTVAREENIRIENGMLVLEARKERYKNAYYDPKSKETWWGKSREYAEYTSGSVSTRGRPVAK